MEQAFLCTYSVLPKAVRFRWRGGQAHRGRPAGGDHLRACPLRWTSAGGVFPLRCTAAQLFQLLPLLRKSDLGAGKTLELFTFYYWYSNLIVVKYMIGVRW